MAAILKATESAGGRVTLSVDVAADTIAEVSVPLWLHLDGGAQVVADAYAARYAARRSRPRRGTT